LSQLALGMVYEKLWTRPGLSLRDRSLVTIAMLIALGNERELRSHIAAGMRNGLTAKELEEVVYHATGYAGFPRASGAMTVVADAVAKSQSGG
jgi:4-carboxymuconolactone decarboxylase